MYGSIEVVFIITTKVGYHRIQKNQLYNGVFHSKLNNIHIINTVWYIN